MANSSTIPFYGVEGPANVGALVRVRVRNPNGTTAIGFPLTEEVANGIGLGVFSSVQTLALADAVTGLPYTWEARQVPTQDEAGFDAPLLLLAPKQSLGWVKNGILLTDPNLDALVSGVFSTTGTGGTIITSGTPTSLYIDWIEFVNDFGMNNLVIVSNKDQTMLTVAGTQAIPKGQPNFYAIQNAFNYATDRIHNILQGGCYKIPLDFALNNGGKVPERVSSWAKIIAYCRLLGMRVPNRSVSGRRAAVPAGPDFATLLEEALLECGAHKYGQWAQMPEAAQAVTTDPGYVENANVFGGVRYIDGRWQFSWIQSIGTGTYVY